jgi:hypothetical protein
MQQIISEEQARAITGGRKPLVPIEYEVAVKALISCQTIDEAKYFSDKSDALAAWAKIYRDPQVENEARKLKLVAYRRMGELANEIQPRTRIKNSAGRCVYGPGPRSLLLERGLNRSQSEAAMRLANTPVEQFQSLVRQPSPPGPIYACNMLRPLGRDVTVVRTAISHLWSTCQKVTPSECARGYRPEDLKRLRANVIGLIEWLDAFEQALPGKTLS